MRVVPSRSASSRANLCDVRQVTTEVLAAEEGSDTAGGDDTNKLDRREARVFVKQVLVPRHESSPPRL